MANPKQHYEVAIAGGGIAGVTLALMLEKLNISYILFEGRDTLESDRGAGIGLQPNGLRILDQLGLVEDIEQATIPLRKWFSYDSEGNMMSDSSAMGQYREKIGYPVAFIERPKLLPIMVRRIQRTECVRTSARVTSIEETDNHVVVTTSSGLSVTADMVVGADGVRSAVRDHIDSSLPQKKIRSADDYIGIGFSTVYGMSAPTEGIAPGERFAVYREQETIIGFTGKDGIVFWFVFENLNNDIPLSHAPRYTEAEAEALCQAVAHVRVTPRLKFGDLFKNRVMAVKIAVEEGVAKRWHTDRAVIVGDAACKTTPAGGQGANQAIESCAVLVNKLMEARKASVPGEKLPREAIKTAFASYAQVRAQSAAMTLERSRMVCSALLCIPGPAAAMVKDMLKLSDEDWLLRAFMALSTAPVLEDVELTARGHLYNKAVKAAQDETERRRNAASPATRVEQKRKVDTPTNEPSELQDPVSLVQAAKKLVEVS
ncbi:FAD/NAD(P)-binding domain-containing protein [Aspergillus alliaceus]|uniref:FAD/NAD(P)-binding domain-containing protein n=1 Tax=Petromyces alliaceus TaxID=209559 RepID=A0A5N7C1M2_PETAA|nr:FAD/NAD(P)-binding domain-containing protein [Aspergillus alliaceus]KAB8237686.1 FAD/NAD(P)-binding domain-containing protein [Aspergillus alliaceus]KAE8387996.1 FAD/NAD(P)-binding domain-containing protein [Aspergillus alliaceus]